MLSGFRRPLKYAVFISGSGSTLQALLEMQSQIDIALVVSSKKNAFGLLKARRFGKKNLTFEPQIDFSKLTQILLDHKIDRIILAGFMKMLPKDFTDIWNNKIMNIHPSLLPDYPGLNSSLRSWQDQMDMGVTIHTVNEEMDKGTAFIQKKSLSRNLLLAFNESEIYLRATEQHLLRELSIRWN